MNTTVFSPEEIIKHAYTIQSMSRLLTFENHHITFYRDIFQNPSQLAVHAAGFVSYETSCQFQFAPIPYYILLHVVKGTATISYDEKKMSLSPQNVFLLSSMKNYQFHTKSTPFYFHICFFSGSCFSTQTERLLQSDSCFFLPNCPSLDLMLHSIANSREKLSASNPNTPLYLSSMLHLFFSSALLVQEMTFEQSHLPKHVQKLKEILDTDYRSQHSLDSLSLYIGVNKFRLCRDFSAYMDISPQKYLNQIRIYHAKQLLHSTDETIHAIGAEVGIENTSHFINLFKKNTGITPLQFRQSYIN